MSDPVNTSPASSLSDLVEIMRRLRDPETGCAWDKEQTFETIAPYTIEEAYEVADAIQRRDLHDLKDELGDLQLQVVYHSRIAEELGAFSIADVIASICDKMIRRHPHIFGDQAESPGWEALKAAERGKREDKSALAGVALALPALKRADKLQKRAARTGFDWDDAAGPKAKIIEELAEIEAAETAGQREAEIGDLLFSVVNYARHLGVDSEAALRGTMERFEARFRLVEQMTDRPLSQLDIEQIEELWQRAKRQLNPPPEESGS
jgi:ATP diphosphatase